MIGDLSETARSAEEQAALEKIAKLEKLVALITMAFRLNMMRNAPSYTHELFDDYIRAAYAEAGL